MSDEHPVELPVLPATGPDQATNRDPSCGPAAYVSNEERAILDLMRRLSERATAVRAGLEAAVDPDQRSRLAAELAELRAERTRLVARRERAYRRKMVMLGHLPPELDPTD